MSLFGALFLLAVSYSRDVAPIFALHCNSCHGDAETAGGLEIRTYAGLMKSDAIVPGIRTAARLSNSSRAGEGKSIACRSAASR